MDHSHHWSTLPGQSHHWTGLRLCGQDGLLDRHQSAFHRESQSAWRRASHHHSTRWASTTAGFAFSGPRGSWGREQSCAVYSCLQDMVIGDGLGSRAQTSPFLAFSEQSSKDSSLNHEHLSWDVVLNYSRISVLAYLRKLMYPILRNNKG